MKILAAAHAPDQTGFIEVENDDTTKQKIKVKWTGFAATSLYLKDVTFAENKFTLNGVVIAEVSE